MSAVILPVFLLVISKKISAYMQAVTLHSLDSAKGGAPSLIVNGYPVGLPMPASAASHATFADLGSGDHSAKGQQTYSGGG